ncbi:MAG: M28 family peptidase, partial [Desulfobacterota bacterium]|nr:M28 family peptidase [Thermodesulfobacteriota bacterium]
FTYRASDGVLQSNTATVTITVNAVNDAPEAADDAISTPEDTAVNIAVLGNDTDVDSAVLTVTGITQGYHGTVGINGDGTLSYTPAANYSGSDTFTYTVSDGALTDTATVSVMVTPVNDMPTSSGIPDVTVDEDASDTVIDLSEFFADVDLPYGDELAYTVTASGSIPILALLDQISQASYTDIHQDLLYTHLGDNRGLTGAQHDLARDNIFDYFEDLGLATSLDPFTYSSKTYYNVVGVQPGAVRPNDIYILGAHYDSVNNPGADDNASGVAAVMEAARILSTFEFDATLVYIAFDREEQGLVGSTSYANKHASDNILGMISFDMIAYNPAGANHNTLRIYDGDGTDDPIMQEMLDSFNALGYGRGITAVDSGSIGQSDHAPFDQRGFEAVLLIEYGVWSNPYYHKSTDAVETANFLDYTFATSITAGGAGYMVSQAGLTPANLPPGLPR